MHTLHRISDVQVLSVGDVVQWDGRVGTVIAVGDTWVSVDGYIFTGDSRARLRRTP